MLKVDVVIIGAGPVGLFSIFQVGMLGLTSCVIDSLEVVGGQCTALYPEKPIYDIPGYPQISAQMLIDQLMEQAAPFNPTFLLNQQAVSCEITNSLQNYTIKITTSRNSSVYAKAVIIAAGSGAFGPNKPPLTGIENFEGKSVFYLVSKRELFRDATVVIAGGGNSALDWVISLSEITKKIYLVHRRNKFKAAPESLCKLDALIAKADVELVVPYQLSAIIGSSDGILERVIVRDLDNNKRILQADYLLPFFGLAMELGPIARWGLQLDKKHIVVNPSNMQTNIPGIFAVGDIAYYAGKLKLILTGFAEAALACHSAYKVIYPDIPMHFEYSTSKGLPER